MRSYSLIVLLVVIGLLMAFKNDATSKVSEITGTYGVSEVCDGTDAKIKLTINNDFTFNYLNHTNPKQLIDVSGNWSLDGRTIVLKNYQSDVVIRNRWKLDKAYPCLKARKGINFTRICSC